MVSHEQHNVLKQLLQESLDHTGDVVEAGCNAGGTSLLLAQWLSGTARRLHLYDSFEGLPESSGYGGQMQTSREQVEFVFSEYRRVEVYAGWFSETMPDELPDEICFAFVDCDVFDSVMVCVPHILERLTGCMVIHDYSHHLWGAGVRRAIETLGLDFEVQSGMAIVRKADQC